jgi:hypothetical protein
VIRLRLVTLLSAFVVLLGGYAAYVAYFRPVPEFTGATDPAHVAAVKALVAALPAPAGARLDPYGTWCDAVAAACWTSTTQQTKALASAITKSLVAMGSRVRSHQCVKPEARPIEAPDGACIATLDYHGSRIDVDASSRGKADNGGRTFVRVDSVLVTPNGSAMTEALEPWTTAIPLPPTWTTAVTCLRPENDGCHAYTQRATMSPVIQLPRAQVCAGVRASLRGRFFFEWDEDAPATASTQGYCQIHAHRYLSPSGKDGELVIARATSVDPTSTTLTFSLVSG